MEINRDSERNEPQVVQSFPEDRQSHSRREREPNQRKDGIFHDGRVRRTTAHQQAQHELAL